MATEMITTMQDQDLRQAFGLRLKELRKQKGWTQKELANQLDIRFSHLNKYESGMHIPPIEKLIQLGSLFNVTLDYLVLGDREEALPLHNTQLIERLKAMESFDNHDQDAVLRLIDAMIVKQRVESAVQPIGRKAS
jgi:transcriptional regulator with XRE-family HTH domain